VGGYLNAVVAVFWTAAASQGRLPVAGARGLVIAGPALEASGLAPTALTLKSGSLAFAVTLAPVGAGVGLAWAHLAGLMIASAEDNQYDLAGAFISTLQLIAQAFAAAFAGLVANLAGFADPEPGPAGVMRGVFLLFLVFSLLAATAVPIGVRAASRIVSPASA
jgi:hypothetical protein